MIKDYLQNIVKNTHDLGFIELVKVTTDDESTRIEATAVDRTVIVQAKTDKPIPEFVGTFGMPKLSKLKTILSIPEYQKAVTTVIKQGTMPAGLHFENETKDFENDYRFMGEQLVEEMVKSLVFHGATWHVEFEPSQASLQRMKYQQQANSEELNFTTRTVGSNLHFAFGDHASHAGDFVFHKNVTGTLKYQLSFPINAVIKILDLPGNKKFMISDDGVAKITVDTGLATYDYYLPALTK